MANNEYAPEAIERAKEKLRDFHDWHADNMRAWLWAERFALEAAAAGRHVGGAAIVEAIRGRDFADRWGTPTKTNNDFAPIIARVLLRHHPELRGHIELRKSAFDLLIKAGAND